MMQPSDSFMSWAGPLCVAVLFCWFLFGDGTSHELLCGDSKTCFRDWVFGTSGWVAVAAAVPTLLFLRKQVSDAEKYAKKMAKISLLAEQRAATNLSISAQVLRQRINDDEPALLTMALNDLFSVRDEIQELMHDLDREDFLGASQKYGFYIDARYLVRRLKRLDRVVESHPPEDEEGLADVIAMLQSLYDMTRSFADSLQKACDDWLAETNRILNAD